MKPIYVRDVYDPEGALSVLVEADEPFEEVLLRFAQEASLRGIFVTDEAGQLMGVITRSDLLNWTRLRLGTALQGLARGGDRILRLAQLVRAGTARDAIHPGSQKTAVSPDDPVDHALQVMLQVDLIAIPVVNNAGQIIGDLTLSHILRYLFDLGRGE
jgi:CBS domain-containing protein